MRRLQIFLMMVFRRDGMGNIITPRDALWYATHPEWLSEEKAHK